MDTGDLPVRLTSERRNFIDGLIAAGTYATPSDVVSAALDALHEHEQSVTDWLRREVGAAYDAITADPSIGLTDEEVGRSLELHRTRRTQAPGDV